MACVPSGSQASVRPEREYWDPVRNAVVRRVDGKEDKENADPADPESQQHADRHDFQTVIRDVKSTDLVSDVFDAIDKAPCYILQDVLRQLVREDVSAKERVEARLLAPITGSSTLKRKQHETCRHCGAEYRAEQNTVGDCIYHEGEKEMDEESGFWEDDWEENGSPSDFTDDKDMQEGFRWSCCDRVGDDAGCIVSRHEPATDERKKANRALTANA